MEWTDWTTLGIAAVGAVTGVWALVAQSLKDRREQIERRVDRFAAMVDGRQVIIRYRAEKPGVPYYCSVEVEHKTQRCFSGDEIIKGKGLPYRPEVRPNAGLEQPENPRKIAFRRDTPMEPAFHAIFYVFDPENMKWEDSTQVWVTVSIEPAGGEQPELTHRLRIR